MVEDVLELLPPGVVLASQAAEAGVGGDALARAVRAGALVRLRAGAYLRAAEWAGAAAEVRHHRTIEAVSRQLRGPVFSHESAAVVWGLPVVGEPGAVHVLGPGRGARHGSGTRAGITRHAAAAGVETCRRGGLEVTSAAQTVVAIASTRDLRRSLPVADRALQAGVVTRDDLERVVGLRAAAPGVRRARLVLELADPRSGSVGESVSRARMHVDGLARPELQAPVREEGRTFAYADLAWEGVGVIGEFDGRTKYRVDGIPDPRAVEDRVWAEKRREDRIRSTGLRVVRWTWQDAWRPGRLRARLVAAGVPLRGRGR